MVKQLITPNYKPLKSHYCFGQKTFLNFSFVFNFMAFETFPQSMLYHAAYITRINVLVFFELKFKFKTPQAS